MRAAQSGGQIAKQRPKESMQYR